MIKLRTVIILFIIYLLAFISLNNNFNLLKPYYYLKDIFLYSVKALVQDKELVLSNNLINDRIIFLEEEIDKLKELTNINNVLTDYNYLNATVIERNREYWFNTLTINKGLKDGIILDMAVIDSHGFIGKIVNIRDNTSDIKLITTNDVNNKISVVIDNIYGITKGYDSKNNLLKVIITEDVDLKGKKVYTTGMGGVFPRGIIIGEVVVAVKDSDDVGNIVLVKLARNIKDVRYVSVLQRKDIN